MSGRRRRRARILAVEDTDTNLKLITLVLSDAGYSVDAVSTARQALARARDVPPDLVLTDIQLPDFDGIVLAGRLRAIPALASVPIVALSASEGRDVQEQARRAGFNAFVTKPFVVESLVDTIANLLAGSSVT